MITVFKENYKEELAVMEEWINKQQFCAIGEIGIDLYWDKTFLKQQQYAFKKQIEWAKEKNLPIVIHCRDAFNEIFEVLEEVKDDKLFGIFHCFTGTLEQAKKAKKIMGVTVDEMQIHIMAPVIRGRKGEHYQLLYDMLNRGYGQARVDGDMKNLRNQIKLSKTKKHDIDFWTCEPESKYLELAERWGKGEFK